MLRDRYVSLQELCDDLDLSVPEIESKLLKAGFTYQPEINQFR